ncbi:MAG: hypothetical protein ACLPN6_24515, partial [Streptosporangiaceae bacterium]
MTSTFRSTLGARAALAVLARPAAPVAAVLAALVAAALTVGSEFVVDRVEAGADLIERSTERACQWYEVLPAPLRE